MTRTLITAFAAAACLALAGCGGDAPDSDAADTAPETATAETVAEAPAEAAQEETPALAAVAESDGSFDPEAMAEEGALRLARSDADAAAPQRFQEGVHFKRFRPAKLTVEGGTGVEVAEVFWYGCNHCYNLEPTLRRWAAEAPENVRFVKVPAVWNPVVATHAQVFYTIEALAGADKLEDKDAVHMAFFDKLHVDRQRMTSESDIAAFLEPFGVSRADFEGTWTSPWVTLRMNQAKRLNQAYGIASVPTIVVNGKYVTDEGMAGSKPALVAVIDELVAVER